MLRASIKAGLYLGVVSNKTGSYLRAEADHLGWTPLFGRLVGAQDAPRDKPAPEPIHLALSAGAVTAGPDVWFVGDAPIDVLCGRAAGCTTIIVGCASGQPFHARRSRRGAVATHSQSWCAPAFKACSPTSPVDRFPVKNPRN